MGLKKEKVNLGESGDSGQAQAKSRFHWFQFKSKKELEEDDDTKFTEDCYSFLALGCGPDNRVPFFYGLLVFAFQIGFLILMIGSKVERSMSANEDIDNPDETGFAEYMPANASLVVRATQYVSIFAFVIFAEDSIGDVVDAVRFFPLPVWSTENLFVSLACVMRFSQGVLACFTVFLLVMTSEDVIDIVLNFTAVNFISSLDDAAFELAKLGRYGDVLKKKAEDIEENIKVEHRCLAHLKDERVVTMDENGEEKEERLDISYKWYIPTVSIIALLLLGFCIHVTIQQSRDDVWVLGMFRVEFDEDTGLAQYSGCYKDGPLNEDRRVVYKSMNHSQQEPLTLEYCKAERRWIFYEEPGEHCTAGETGHLKAQSGKTNAFSVTTAMEGDWFSPFKKPLEMYFLEDEEENLFCGNFALDGTCDDELNNFDYKFDGGDCCGTTCHHINCGKNNVIYAFNQELTNDVIGFPKCSSLDMVENTVGLSEFNFQNIADDLDSWQTFWSPRLEMVCGEGNRLVFSIPVSNSMYGYSYDEIRTESESDCDIIAINFEPYFGSLNKYFSVYDHISFNGGANVNIHSRNSIPTNFDSLEGRTALSFDSASNYTISGTIPTEMGSLSSLEEVNLSNNALSGTIPKEVGTLKHLTNLVLDSNELTGPIPAEITSLLGLTTLILSNNALQGTIPHEIGLLTKLTYLDLRNNALTGLIPSEIESLPDLQYLYLNENSLKGSIDCSQILNVWDEELCQSLNSFPRWDSESPTVSPAPSNAPSVSSAPTVSNAPTITAQPTSVVSPVFTTVVHSHLPTDSPPDCLSIAEILCEENEFVSMCTLMQASGNAEDILSSSNSTWTVFAPTNNGFSRYYTENGVKFNFGDLFWFHTVEDEEIYKDDLPCDAGLNLVTMTNGKDSRTLCDRRDNPIGQKGYGNEIPIPFVEFDKIACNGVIHTISDVLLYRPE